MRPFMDQDRVGLLPPGIGHKSAEPEAPAPAPRVVTVESVLADIASLSEADRIAIRTDLNLRVFSLPPMPVRMRDDYFGKPMTGYIDPAIYAEAPGS